MITAPGASDRHQYRLYFFRDDLEQLLCAAFPGEDERKAHKWPPLHTRYRLEIAQRLYAYYASLAECRDEASKGSRGALVRIGEAEKITGLNRYTLLGLAQRGDIRLKCLPNVSNPRSGRVAYYLFREDLERLLDVPPPGSYEAHLEQERQSRAERRAIWDRARAEIAQRKQVTRPVPETTREQSKKKYFEVSLRQKIRPNLGGDDEVPPM
jgi:hypothetical protein